MEKLLEILEDIDDSIDFEKKMVTVLVDFFGRPAPAELEFDEIKNMRRRIVIFYNCSLFLI